MKFMKIIIIYKYTVYIIIDNKNNMRYMFQAT